MNVPQLFRLLARHLTVEDPTNLQGNALLDVLAAANAGIAKFYAHAPDYLREREFSRTFRAPDNPIVLFTKYSTQVQADWVEAHQHGCTIRIADYVPDNIVLSHETVLDEYLGETGEKTVQVLHDASGLNATFRRLIGAPTMWQAGMTQRVELTHDSGLHIRRRDNPVPPGTPKYFSIVPAGIALRDASVFYADQFLSYLLIHPAPATDCIVRFRAEVETVKLSALNYIAHSTTFSAVPVPDHCAENLLVPLCEAELTTSPLWRDPATKTAVRDRADRVLETEIKLLVPSMLPGGNPMGREKNF